MRGALAPQESTDFFSEFFFHPRLAAQPSESSATPFYVNHYMTKYKFLSTGMCDTWLERSWREDQICQKNQLPKINFKASKIEKTEKMHDFDKIQVQSELERLKVYFLGKVNLPWLKSVPL